MVTNEKEHKKKKPAKQAFQETPLEPNKIGASTPYEFRGKNLTAYGGLLPVATMLEKLGFQSLVEETVRRARVAHQQGKVTLVDGVDADSVLALRRIHRPRRGVLRPPRAAVVQPLPTDG